MLIVSFTVLCIALGVRMNGVQTRQRAVAHIRSMNGRVDLDNYAPVPRVLQPLTYPQIRSVWWADAKLSLFDVQQLNALDSLERLHLDRVTFERGALQRLRLAKSFHSLSLNRCAIDDEDSTA
jgi:hypothetical protein